jgi:hypothetical protein
VNDDGYDKSWDFSDEEREAWIAGMREMCDTLEAYPNIPLPSSSEWFTHRINMSKYLKNEDTGEWETEYDTLEMKAAYKRAAKALIKAGADKVTKQVPAADSSYGEFRISRYFGPHRFAIALNQDTVCERVLVEEVVIPAEPEKVEVIPAKPERVEKKYEYRCANDLVSVLK